MSHLYVRTYVYTYISGRGSPSAGVSNVNSSGAYMGMYVVVRSYHSVGRSPEVLCLSKHWFLHSFLGMRPPTFSPAREMALVELRFLDIIIHMYVLLGNGLLAYMC